MVNPLGSPEKQWVFSAIGAGVGLASSLYGGITGANAAKEAARRQRQQEAKEDAWYSRRYNEDYADTAAGQNLVRKAKGIYERGLKQAEGAAKVAGGTDAATAMAKEALNKGVGDTIADMAATDQARKAQVDNMHRRAQDKFMQMDMAREQQRAQNITNAAQGASNAIMSAASAVDQANTPKASLQGGNNNGTPMTQVAGGGKVYSNGSTVLNLTDLDKDMRSYAAATFR